MNKIWTFGDSFTYGAGCNDYDDYYKNYPKKRGLKFNKILSNHYELPLKDFSLGGASNAWILRQMVNNIHKFEEGDIISINLTDKFRLEMPNPHQLDDLQPILSHAAHKENPVFGEFEPNGNENDAVYSYVKYIHMMDVEDKDIKTTGYEVLYKLYMNQFDSICKLLSKLNVKYVLWDWQDFALPGPFGSNNTRYDNITSCTNGEMDDFHLSWKGHIELSNDLITCLDNNIQHLADIYRNESII